MSDAVDDLQKVSDETAAMTDETAKAHAYHDAVLPAMAKLRASADAAEEICREDYWPAALLQPPALLHRVIGRQHLPCYFLLAVQIRSGVPNAETPAQGFGFAASPSRPIGADAPGRWI